MLGQPQETDMVATTTVVVINLSGEPFQMKVIFQSALNSQIELGRQVSTFFQIRKVNHVLIII